MSLSSSPLLQRLMDRRRFGMKPGLDTIRALMARLGNVQKRMRYIHVAGTNGKGAVCAILDSILRQAGHRVARYTSPHLVRIAERFFIDGAPASDEALDAAAAEVFPQVEALERETGCEVTFFECLTAVAFVLFAKAGVDIVVLETGLGGRMDATNVVDDVLVSVITRIGLDHCEWLGNTHTAIAAEKAGIIKQGRPVVCGVMPEAAKEEIERVASLNGCRFVAADEHVSVESVDPLILTTAVRNLPPVKFALFGAFQVENAMIALAVCDVLGNIPDHAVKAGLEKVEWPGRCQKVVKGGVTYFVDGAHNPDGAMALRDSLKYAGVEGPVGLVAGFCGDKDVLAHLRIMSGIAVKGWAVPIRNSRSLDPAETAERMLLAGFSQAEACGSLAEALAKADCHTVVVCGSLFLAGEALMELGVFPWSNTDPNEKLLT